jgi:hypothetical protein
MKYGVLSQASKRVGGRSIKHAGKRKSVAGVNSWIILTISILDKMVTK